MEWVDVAKRTKLFVYYLIEYMIRNISGGLGERIRYKYYRSKLLSCGANVKIGIGVKFTGIAQISIGDDVWVDDYCILIAGMPTGELKHEVRFIKNKDFLHEKGHLAIGSKVHIAPYCLINAFGGGIFIDDYCGLSSGIKIYSVSNHYRSKEYPSKITYSNPMVKNLPIVLLIYPVVLNKNCFVTINSTILGGSIGENSYIAPYTLVASNFKENSIISGNPAIRVSDRFENYKQ